MIIIQNEFVRSRRPYIISSIVLSAIIILSFSLYPLYYSNLDYFKALFDKFPPTTLSFLGIAYDYGNILSYYTFIFTFLAIICAFRALLVGMRIFSIDNLEQRARFYYVKPIERKRVFLYKVIGNLAWLVISFVWYHLLSFILILIFKRNSISNLTILQINTSLLLLEIVFFFIGLIVGSFLKKEHRLWVFALVIVIIFKCISFIDSSLKIVILRYINPFSYFTVSEIIEAGKYQYRFLIVTVVIVFFLYQFCSGIYENEEIGGDSFD